jgi:hypothetical protein
MKFVFFVSSAGSSTDTDLGTLIEIWSNLNVEFPSALNKLTVKSVRTITMNLVIVLCKQELIFSSMVDSSLLLSVLDH